MPGTPTQSYVFFNSLIDVDVVKVDTDKNVILVKGSNRYKYEF